MTRFISRFILFSFLILWIQNIQAGDSVQTFKQRHPLELSQIQITGELSQRVDLALSSLIDTRERLFMAEGHTQGWGMDGVGRWIYAMTQIAGIKGTRIPELDEAVRGTLRVQLPDGSWGQGDWGHWGNSRALIGLLAVLLQKAGNPANMGICVACFTRDITGALGLHRAAVVQYVRPEIPGFILGAMVAALAFGEFKARAGSAPLVRFVLGGLAMTGALAFLGCPWRALLRFAEIGRAHV